MPTSAFGPAVQVAIKRADRLATADLGSTIVMGLMNLDAAAAVFRTPNYQTAYNERPAEVFQDLTTRSDGIYQQLHALCEQIAQLIRQTSEPPLGASSLAGLAVALDRPKQAAAALEVARETRAAAERQWQPRVIAHAWRGSVRGTGDDAAPDGLCLAAAFACAARGQANGATTERSRRARAPQRTAGRVKVEGVDRKASKTLPPGPCGKHTCTRDGAESRTSTED